LTPFGRKTAFNLGGSASLRLGGSFMPSRTRNSYLIAG